MMGWAVGERERALRLRSLHSVGEKGADSSKANLRGGEPSSIDQAEETDSPSASNKCTDAERLPAISDGRSAGAGSGRRDRCWRSLRTYSCLLKVFLKVFSMLAS